MGSSRKQTWLASAVVGLIMLVPATKAPANDAGGRIAIGSPNLLRNDEITVLSPLSPALATLFTGGSSGCSPDASVTLDAGDPGGSCARVEGEGSALSGNGSDDPDDLYIVDFTPAGTIRMDPELGSLSDSLRPLILYQIENACDPNGVRLVKNAILGSVEIALGDAVPCPTGACCTGGVACSDDALEFECVGAGGQYRGDGTTCASSSCNVAVGACCDVAGCRDGATQAGCQSTNGSYLGDGTTCTTTPCPTGSCCNVLNGICAVTTQLACVSQFGSYMGDGTDCTSDPCPTGACCDLVGCRDVTRAECQASFGDYHGDGSSCATTPCGGGACCDVFNGVCFISTQTACVAQFGTYMGDGTDCTSDPCPTGACCDTLGCRDDVTRAECQASFGDYLGDGTSCAGTQCPSGACCDVPNGVCYIASRLSCEMLFGTYMGDGTDCTTAPCPSGACCTGATCEDDVAGGECTNSGGSYQGDGSTCATLSCATGACCAVLGCVDGVTSTRCTIDYGGTYQGDGTDCATVTCP